MHQIPHVVSSLACFHALIHRPWCHGTARSPDFLGPTGAGGHHRTWSRMLRRSHTVMAMLATSMLLASPHYVPCHFIWQHCVQATYWHRILRPLRPRRSVDLSTEAPCSKSLVGPKFPNSLVLLITEYASFDTDQGSLETLLWSCTCLTKKHICYEHGYPCVY